MENKNEITLHDDNFTFKDTVLVAVSSKGITQECLTIPNGVISIAPGAFSGCKNLKEVKLPPSITSIGDFAFQNCLKLNEINLPNSVKIIGPWAFFNCERLHFITIPSSVTSIGPRAFQNCHIGAAGVINHSPVLFDWWVKHYCDDRYNYLTLSEMSDIDLNDFTNSDGQPFEYIAPWTFSNCQKLKSITFKNVTHIGNHAFEDCKSLKQVIIPQSVTSIGESAFYQCKSLDFIAIPKSVKSIGDYAFAGCHSKAEFFTEIQNGRTLLLNSNSKITKEQITVDDECEYDLKTVDIELKEEYKKWKQFQKK